MNKFLIFILFFIFAFTIAAETFIKCEINVTQGEILPVYIFSDKPLEKVQAQIKNNNKLYGLFKGFSYNISDSEDNCNIILFSSDSIPDQYEMELKWIEDDINYEKVINITVLPGIFKKEDISLTKTLTALRKDVSNQRKKETTAIIRLYKTFNKENCYLKEKFSYPLKIESVVTSFFGDRRNFIYNDGETSRSLHNGIDFAAPQGTPVYSCGSGRVVFAGNRIVTGNSVIIEHLPGLYSVYYHLKMVTVLYGENVLQGMKIGEVGSTGISTGSHLHWEIRNQFAATDPEQFIADSLIDKSKKLSNIKFSISDIDRGR